MKDGGKRCGALVMGVIAIAMSGCMGRYALDRRPVRQISEAEQKSRTRSAYERARERVRGVREGMSPAEVQATLGAVIAVEAGESGREERRKLMDGFVCRVNPTSLQERWLFGYDEGGVLLVGFAVEFVREDAKDDAWVVKGVDRSPKDDCPIVGDTYLD